MTIFGASDNVNVLLQSLDEHKLIDLCADILAVDEHTDIRITDGPGDGQRDIHSQNAAGDRHLTQAKYHSNLSRSVSAKELGEVVLGMVRLDYKKGLFVTNARISPAAKRDCLNGYSGFEVGFLDGREIAKRILGNLVLKAIWYDGTSLNRVMNTLIVPIAARDLETDKSIPFLLAHQESLQGNACTVGLTQVQTHLRRNSVNTMVFWPYRSPRVRTISELGTVTANLTEFVLSGIIHLGDVKDLLPKIAEEALIHVRNMYPSKRHFAVLAGYPSLAPLGGEAAGARIELKDHEPIVMVSHDGVIQTESEWILPSERSGWLLPDRPHVSQAEWIKWYFPKLDICFDIIVQSPPSDASKWFVEEQRNHFLKFWNQSLFMLVPSVIKDTWTDTGLPEPEQWYQWSETEMLAAWPYPMSDSPFMELDVQPDDESISTPLFPEPEPQKAIADMNGLRTQVECLGGRIVEPKKARHMVAIIKEDPIPGTETIDYPGRCLVYDSPTVPSPIDPNSRLFQFTCCWQVEPKAGHSEPPKAELNEFASRLSQQVDDSFSVSTYVDSETESRRTFLISRIDYIHSLGFDRTSDILKNIEGRIEAFLLRIEDVLRSTYEAKRATEYYWEKEIGLTFRKAE